MERGGLGGGLIEVLLWGLIGDGMGMGMGMGVGGEEK